MLYVAALVFRSLSFYFLCVLRPRRAMARWVLLGVYLWISDPLMPSSDLRPLPCGDPYCVASFVLGFRPFLLE